MSAPWKTILDLTLAGSVSRRAMVPIHDPAATDATRISIEDLITSVTVDATYRTRDALTAETVSPAVTTVRTLGYAAIGDRGGAMYERAVSQLAAGPGAVRSADRFLPNGGLDLVNGGWWTLTTWVLTPEMVGALPGTDCTEAFRVLGQLLQWRGGGEVRALGRGTYDLWSTGVPTGYDALIVVSQVPITFDMGAATIRSTRDWYAGAASSARAVIIQATNCDGVIVKMKTIQTVRNAANFLRGLVPLAVVDACRHVRAELDMVGGNFGVWVSRGVGWTGQSAEDIQVDLTVEDVFYPLAGSENGRNIRGTIRSKGAGRSVLLAGCKDVDLLVITDNAGEFGDVKIVTYLDGSSAASRETSNINVRVVHRPTGTVPLSALVSLEFQFRSGAPAAVVGRLNGVNIEIDADYTASPNLMPNAIVEAMVGTAGGVIAPARLEAIGLKVTGRVLGNNRQGPVIVDLWNRGAEGFGPLSVAGVDLNGIDRGTDGADFQVDWRINCAVVTSAIRLTDIHAPRDVLTLLGYTPGRVRSSNAIFRLGHDRDLQGRPVTIRLTDGAQLPALEVISSGWFGLVHRRAEATANAAIYRGEKARGTPDAPAAVVAGDYITGLIGAAWDGAAWSVAARLQQRVTRIGGPNDFDVAWELETRLGATRTTTFYASPQGRYGFGGVFDPACTVDAAGPVRSRPVTVSALPAAATVAGAAAFVSDATQPHAAGLGTAVVGGGTHFVPVYSNGSAWIIG